MEKIDVALIGAGAYSYPRVGGAGAGRALARPIKKTLFLAGEATAGDGENGTVEGALASGRRAVRQVMRALESPSVRNPY